MEVNGCYACGQGIPRLVGCPEGGFAFECTRCGAKTKQKALDQALNDWNEGIIYTGPKFWKLVFAKVGERNGC